MIPLPASTARRPPRVGATAVRAARTIATSATLLALAALAALASPGAARADAIASGGDTFVAAPSAMLASEVARDAFLAGNDVVLGADVAGDAHLAGFAVTTRAAVGGDVYAAGGSVTLAGPVGEDLTASGFSVRLELGTRVAGNTRLAGGTVTVDAPLDGALLVAGGSVTIDAPIAGDVRVTAGELRFGENARIGGRLDWAAPEAPAIPAAVIPAERVRRMPYGGEDGFREIADAIDESVPALWPSLVARVTALLVLLGFLLALAAVLFAFAPHAIETLRRRALAHPGLALLGGALGLSALVGALPVAAITLVGIPLLPVLLLGLVVVWTLGYGLGVHVVATRLWRAFDGVSDGIGTKLATLAAALVAIVALNFIPVVGWLVNLAVLLLGIGAMTLETSARLASRAA